MEQASIMYKTYLRHREELKEALKDYSELIDRKTELFQRTQPSSVSADSIGGSAREGTDKIDSYLIISEREQLDPRIKAAREIIEESLARLKYDEEYMRTSGDKLDRICYEYFCNGKTAELIAEEMHYAVGHVYRLLRVIKR